ncbi:MAG: aminotransferase class IV [Arcobacteraceae bacterium]
MKKSEVFFETIKCDDGIAYNLDYHCQRIARTIMININLHEYVLPINDDFLRCKVLYNKHGVIDVLYEPYIKRIFKKFKIIHDDTIEYKYKSTNREQLNALLNKKEQSDEIIIVKNGFVTDTSISNIAIYDGEFWITSKTPLLRGTTQERLIKEKEVFAANISVEMLKNAKKIALLNAMMGMRIITDYSILE